MPKSSPSWSAGPDTPTLAPGEVHVWQFDLRACERERDSLQSLLEEHERNRARRFGTDDLARRYEVGHGRLRRVVARYLHTAPETIRFCTGSHGKPSIDPDQNPMRLELSFAHSGESALVGVVLDRAIGVDLEVYRPRVDMDLIARRQFAPGEAARLSALPAPQRQEAFYACWTRKEAYLKARGEGLTTGLDSFEVTCLPDEPAELLGSVHGRAECARWKILPLDLGPGCAAACVVERPVDVLRCWTFEAGDPPSRE